MFAHYLVTFSSIFLLTLYLYLGLIMVGLLLLSLLGVVVSQDVVMETQTGRQGGFVSLRCGFSDVVWTTNRRGEVIDVQSIRWV